MTFLGGGPPDSSHSCCKLCACFCLNKLNKNKERVNKNIEDLFFGEEKEEIKEVKSKTLVRSFIQKFHYSLTLFHLLMDWLLYSAFLL